MATMAMDSQQLFRTALGQFAAALPKAKGSERTALITQLRHLALASELRSAAEVVDGMADAIVRDGGSALLGPWLAAIDQAAAHGTGGEGVAPVLLATVGVRYAH